MLDTLPWCQPILGGTEAFHVCPKCQVQLSLMHPINFHQALLIHFIKSIRDQLCLANLQQMPDTPLAAPLVMAQPNTFW